jgi:TRAP-type mannitol/chloroaromatic compound transport system permease small subunit
MCAMQPLLRLAAAIDGLNDRIGRFAAWLVVVMLILGSFNAIARYAGRFIGRSFSSNAYLEAQWYLFSLMFLLAAAWVLKEDAHVRVDVLYGRLSERGRAWTNLLGGLILLLPFCAFALWASIPSVRNSWAARETSPDPGGLLRYPLKTFILVCFALLLLQGIAELIKAWQVIREVPGAHVPEEHRPEGV